MSFTGERLNECDFNTYRRKHVLAFIIIFRVCTKTSPKSSNKVSCAKL